MTEVAPVTRQVRIDELGRYYELLHRALQGAGLQPDAAAQILKQSLSVSCVQCGLILSGQEVHSLSRTSSGPGEPSANPKMQRAAQGYCGRAACDSRFYEIRLAPYPAIDWQWVLELMDKGGQTPASTLSESGPGHAPAAGAATKRKRKTFLVVGLAVLVVLIVIRFFIFGGSIPGFEPEPKFQIDPTSLRDHQR